MDLAQKRSEEALQGHQREAKKRLEQQGRDLTDAKKALRDATVASDQASQVCHSPLQPLALPLHYPSARLLIVTRCSLLENMQCIFFRFTAILVAVLEAHPWTDSSTASQHAYFHI